jgi:glycine betaine/choline ABC-type transport system substrate-binding protein
MRRGASLTLSVSSAVACGIAALGLAGCGSGSRPATAATPATSASTSPSPSTSPTTTTVTTTATITTTTTATTTVTLPGAGRPPVTIGDENTPEQFLLGQLYYQALKAQGFTVTLNQSIGPPEVIRQAMANGQLAMYPEYLDTWDSTVAGIQRSFKSRRAAFVAGQQYALKQGLALLNPTPFSDTNAIAVAFDYAVENNIQSIPDLMTVAPQLTLGGAPQFQQSPTGLPALEQTYGVTPAAFKPLELGAQYMALDSGTVQAAVVSTTDPQLLSGGYPLLADPQDIFGWGNVVPVASVRVLDAEGPAFEATIDRVSALLTLPMMRELNAAVEIDGEDPATVATQFLQQEGVLPQPPTTSTSTSTSTSG